MKKDDIVNAARSLFTDYGYKKVSMEEIASKAGVTKKTIYNYFHDKEELFEYFIKEELEKMTEVFEENLKEKKSFSERITKGLKEILIFRKNSGFIRTIMKDISGNTNFISQYDEALINYLEEKINIAISKKEIKKCDSHLAAFIIYKVCFSIFFEYDEKLDEDRVVKEVTAILKDGLFVEGEK